MDQSFKNKVFLSAKDISSLLGISVRYAQCLMHEMPCINIGHGSKALLRITQIDFYEWLESPDRNNKANSSMPVEQIKTQKQQKYLEAGTNTILPWNSTEKVKKRK